MSSPDDQDPNYSLLVARFTAAGQWDRVLSTAGEWLAAEPDNGSAHFAAGHALINLDRYDEAERFLSQVLARQPEHDVAHRFMSMVRFEQGRFKEADEFIHRAISLDPNDAFHWYHLGHMCYQQKDLVSGRKYAERALALAPRNAGILNLLALCGGRDEGNGAVQLRRYEEALELNPESPEVHNNIGVHHLNVGRDYAAAEACFRRALFFDPTLKVARANLFLALKHNDRWYRWLCAPKDLVFRIYRFLRAKRRENFLVYLLILPVWFFLCRPVLALLLLWLLLVWPLVKVYEFLIIGDLRAKAGELGARRGGFLGYRRWPLRWRLGLFGAVLLAFWGGIAFLCFQDDRAHLTNTLAGMFGLAVFGWLIFVLGTYFRKWTRELGGWRHGRRRAKQFGGMLEQSGRQRGEVPRVLTENEHE